MKRCFLLGILLLTVSFTASADSILWLLDHPYSYEDLWRITLTAKTVPVYWYAPYSCYYYQGSTLSFELYKSEDPRRITAEWWVVVTDGTTTFVNATNSDPDSVTVPFSRGGDFTLYCQAWWKSIFTSQLAFSKNITFRSDPAGPALTITPADDDWRNGDVTLTVSASDAKSGVDPATWQYSWDNVNWHAIPATSSTISFTDSTLGSSTIYFKVADKVGNWGSASKTVSIDSTAPTVTPRVVTSGVQFGVWTTQPSVQVTADYADVGGSGVNTSAMTYSLNGSADQAWNGMPISVSAFGSNVVQFTVRDNAGNATSGSGTLKIDPAAPTVALRVVTSGVQFGDWTALPSVQVTADCADTGGSGVDTSTMTYSLNGGTDQAWNGQPIDVSALGITTVQFNVRDNACNAGSGSGTVKIDRTVPTVAVSDPGWTSQQVVVDQSWLLSIATLTDDHSGVDLSSLRYQITGGPVVVNGDQTVPAGTATTLVIEGVYTLTLLVKDEMGNEGTGTASIRIDTTSPTIALDPRLVPDPGTQWSNASGFSATAGDALSQVSPATWQWSVVNVTVHPELAGVLPASGWEAGRIAEIPAAVDGQFEVWFRVSDNAGNSTTSTNPGVVNIDRTGPVISDAGSGWISGGALGSQATDSGVGVDQTSWTWSTDGTSWQSGLPSGLPSGEQAVWLSVADALGNRTERLLTVQVDNDPPSLSAGITTAGVLPATWTNAASVAASATAMDPLSGVDPESSQYSLDGGGSWIAGNTVSVESEGQTLVTFKASDLAGNEGFASVAVWIARALPVVSPQILTAGVLPGAWSASGSVAVHGQAMPGGGAPIDPSSWFYSLDAGATWIASVNTVVTAQGKTTVLFRVSDGAGNTGTGQLAVWIDRSGPTITATTAPFSTRTESAEELSLSPISAADALSSLDSSGYEYSFDSGASLPLPFTPLTGGSVSTLGLTEGQHVLNLSVADVVGNRSSCSLSFIVDRTAPVISTVAVTASNGAISEDQYGTGTSVEIQTTASDAFGGDTPGQGTVAAIEYLVAQAWAEDPDFSSAHVSSGSGPFTVSGLANGINYLSLQAVDGAGNHGVTFTRIVRMDNGRPPAPRVTGLTHPRAVNPTDAVAIRTAVFLLSTSATVGSGLQGFPYTLRKGQSVYAEAFLAAGVENRLDFPNLPDNDQAEYYILTVSARAGNGMDGDQSPPYQFRIDNTPPQSLKVIASSHGNPDVWYFSSRETFLWQQPLDMTGVRSFSYVISAIEVPLPATASEAEALDISQWTHTTSFQATVDLKDVLNQPTAQAWFVLCAEDFAGNRQFDEVSLRYDTVKPSLGTLPSGTSSTEADTSRAADRMVTLIWGDPTDDNAVAGGTPEVAVQLSAIEPSAGTPTVVTNWQILDVSARSLTFDGLSTGIAYLATLRVTDGAGNNALYLQAFSLDGTSLPPTASVPFSENVNGYLVYGTRRLDGQGFDAYLRVPGELSLLETTPEAPAGDIHLDSVEFGAAGQIVGASCAEPRTFTLSVKGFALSATGVALEPFSGFSLATATYSTNVVRDGADLPSQFVYDGVGLTFPPLTQFSGSSSVVVSSFSLPTYHRAPQGLEPTFVPGWTLANITTTDFRESYWEITAATLETGDLFARFGIDASVSDAAGPHRSIPLSNVMLTSEHEIARAQVPDDFTLTFGSSTYLVRDAQLRGNQLVIAEADLQLPSGYSPASVSVRNFTMDSDGLIAEGPDFEIGSFSFADAAGNLFTVTAVQFQGTNLVATEGSVQTVAGAEFAFDGLRLTSNGAAWDLPVVVEGSFTTSLFGYTVSSQNAQLTADGILLPDAVVSGFPVEFGGGSHSMHGLALRLSDYYVVQPGHGTDAFSFVPPYGSALSVSEIALTSSGLFASQCSVALPAVLGGGAIAFANLQMQSNGTLGVSDAAEESFTFIAGAFAAIGNAATFDGATISLETAHVVLPDSASLSVVDFTGMKISGACVTSAGRYFDALSWYENGWSYSLEALSLGDTGITANATLYLPGEFGNRLIAFPLFTLFPDGSSASGSAADAFYVRLFGWKVLLSGISVEGSHLVASSGTVPLYSIMGEGQLVIPDIVLDSSGTVLSSGSGSDTVQFLAENGFLVDATSYTFAADGLRLGGKIYFPEGLGETVYASYGPGEILLPFDGTVQTQPSDTPVNYTLGGWTIEAHGYSFDAEGLTIENSYADVPSLGIRLSFPALSFYPDGGMRAGGVNLEGFTLPLFGGSVGVTQIRLTDVGVNLACFITLPPNLGGYSIYFDELTLHPDGTISTDVAVPEMAFSVQSFDFLFRNIRFDEGALSIGEAQLTLPPELDGKQIHLYDFSIDSSGHFQLGGLGFDPFQMWGYTFSIDSIGFVNDVISFEGSITLPDSFPTGLAGKTIAISDFKVTTGGVVQSFRVSLEGTIEFPLGDSWTVAVTTIGIQKDGQTGVYLLTLDEATLSFPPDFGIADASISGVRINPLTAEFAFDNISIGGVEAEAFGLSFYLDKISISSTFDMDFSGRVTLPATESMPEPLRGRVILVSQFQLNHDGSFGNIAGSLGGIEGTLWQKLMLRNGTIGFSKQTGGLLLSVSGDVQFMADFPDGIAGKSVHLSTFTLDTSSWTVTAFAAQSDPLSFSLFGVTDIEDAVLGMQLNQVTGHVEASVSGSVVLPATLPAVLASRSVSIETFSLDLAEARILSFAASLALSGEQPLFAGINLRDANLGAAFEGSSGSIVFSVQGCLALSSSFPQGLAGIAATITSLVFDSAGALRDLNAEVSFPDQKLFDTLAIRDGVVAFVKSGSTNMTISVRGDVILPDSFPQGLAGLPIHINDFTVDSRGILQNLDIGASGINVSVFDILALQNGAIHATANGSSEFIFGVTGDIVLPASLPQGLSGLTLSVRQLDISSQRGILAFSAGVTSAIHFDLYAGIQGSFTTVALSQTGFQLQGTLTFPQSFPQGLAGMVISLDELEMTWAGEMTSISAGIASAQITLGGFSASLSQLMFQPSGIALGSLTVTMPPNMGSKVVGVRNAGWDSSGTFHGDFVIPQIDVFIAGFTLSLVGPCLDVPGEQISFSQARLLLPVMLGHAYLTLNGVKVGPAGLAFTGGAFSVPDFTIAGGLGFEGIHVNFSLDGSTYFIEGGGKAFVPGAGTFEAQVSFTNRSPAYPIGLKRAFFSYEVSGPGLPLGPTGLYLNGIRGGIAFGPPDEVPDPVEYLFPDPGTRLQLGLTLSDAVGGKTLRGTVDVWVDITNWTWAFKGSVAVLGGFFNADLVAAFNARGFYGMVYVELRFVRGQVQLWVADTKVAGSGYVQFGIPAGFIIDRWIWRWHILVPSRSLLLPPVNAEFGHFTTGDDGFKGWVDLPIIGSAGIFLARDKKPVVGNVSEFVLVKPAGGAMNLMSAPAATAGADSGRVVLYDRLPTPVTEVYQFTVPGLAGTTPDTSTRFLSGMRDMAPQTTQLEVPDVERIIFVLGVAEGDPQLTAISPSGARHAPGDSDVLVQRTEWGYLMAVLDPEPGTWTAEVSGAVSPDSYSLSVLGTTAIPSISLSEPGYSGMQADTGVTVSGIALARNGTAGTVTIYVSADGSSYSGQPVATVTPSADGSFSAPVDTSGLAEGEYWLFAGIRPDEVSPERRAYAPGSIVVTHYQPLEAVTGLVAGENRDGGIDLHFSDPNGSRTQGYNLHITDTTNGEVSVRYLGRTTDISVPGFPAGDTYSLSIGAIDSANRESALSNAVTVAMAGPKLTINEFTIGGNSLDPVLTIGDVSEGAITVNTAAPMVTDSSYDYLVAEVTTAPAGLSVAFTESLWRISDGGAAVRYTLYPQPSMAPGSYQVTLTLSNQGNLAETRQVLIPVTVGYPSVTVGEVAPDSWNTTSPQALDVYGTDFFPGTRVFLDEVELPLTLVDTGHLQCIAPAALAAGQHAVTVRGPAGDAASIPVNLVAPDYQILAYKSVTVAQTGSTSAFFFTIRGLNEFSETVSFSLGEVPADWTATLDRAVLSVGELATVTVTVPMGTPEGTSILPVATPAGDILPLEVTVSATAANPTISALSAPAGFVGDSVTIYGYGFGGVAAVLLGTMALPVTGHGVDYLTVEVPAGAASNDITVVRDGICSNAVPFYVKSLGFSIYPEAKSLSLQPGETRTIDIWVSGYAEAVSLSASTVDSNVTVSLSGSQIVPNGSVKLTVEVPAGAPSGTYPVTISGASGNVSTSAVVQVSVGATFAIVTTVLPNGMEGVDYLARVVTSNGVAPVAVRLEAGRMPYGLGLSSDGTISGRPGETGTLRFTIEAEDGEGRARTQALSITVTENAWGLEARDGGRSRYNPVPSPADGRLMWASTAYIGTETILTGHARVFVRTTLGALGLDQDTGRLLYRIPGSFTQWAYAGQVLYLLDSDGRLSAVESLSGNELWVREGVQRFSSDGTTIVLSTADGAQVVDAATGSLGAVLGGQLTAGDRYLWQNGVLLGVHQDTVMKLASGGWETVYVEPMGGIVDAAADTTNLFLLSGSGRLVKLDSSLAVTAEVETGMFGGLLALGDARVEVAGATALKVYSRAQLSPLYTAGATVSRMAAASEKLFVAGSAGLAALNGYDGTVIWSDPRPCTEVVIAGQSVYALSASGSVLRYNAPDNLAPPTTTITLAPPAPDGTNGYYLTSPKVTLGARDVETYVAGTWYRYGDLGYVPYSTPFTLPDGILSVLAYSMDSRAFRELDKRVEARVDTVAPTTTLSISGTPGDNGYYLTPVGITLEGLDAVSGIDLTEYTLDGVAGRYAGPVSLGDGNHTYSYRSKDIAGNWEPMHEADYQVDLYPPEASAEVLLLPGVGVVYLTGTDGGSGVARLEYIVDGGALMSYLDPIAITVSGTHVVSYRAVDRAGQSGDWQTVTVVVPMTSSSEWIRDLEFSTAANGRAIVTNVQVGQGLYWPTSEGRWNRIAALPGYLVGADYILTNVSDAHTSGSGPFITFTAGTDLDVYVMKNKNSGADFIGWTQVQANYPVEPGHYFRGGADIYTKWVVAGDTVAIPHNDVQGEGGGNLVFVQRAASAAVWITSPMPGEDLAPLSEQRFAYVRVTGQVFSPQWWVRYGGGEWQSLGTATSGFLSLPYTDTELGMDLRLDAVVVPTEGADPVSVQKLVHYRIVNGAGVKLLNPGPGTEVLPGESVGLLYQATGIGGEAMPEGAVSWQDSRDGVSWASVQPDGSGHIVAPVELGPWYLKATLDLGPPAGSREYQWRFTVADAWQPVSFEMAPSGTGEHSDGSVVGVHASGKVYGFAPSHQGQGGTFHADYGATERDESFIRLLQSGYFEYDAGVGRYKVTVTVAPLGRYEPATVTVNGASYAVVGSSQPAAMVQVVAETTSVDGRLLVGGSAGLPILRVEVQRLAPEAPAVSPAVTQVQNVEISQVHEGWGE